MSTQRFTPEFKEEAVKQVVERGYSVPDVAALLGVSAHSLYKGSWRFRRINLSNSPRNCWKPRARFFACAPRCAEWRRSVTCYKKPRGNLPGSPGEVPFHERALS